MTEQPNDENGMPPVVPEYARPDSPGIAMNFDNSVSILHVVQAHHSFEQAAADCLDLVRQAQADYPDWPRQFFLEIDGHENDKHGFDDDFVEFQQEFFFSTIAHFVTAFELPLTGPLVNPNRQRNDPPDRIAIDSGN